jgi:hypothetical protein
VSPQDDRPAALLRVVRGEPSPAELAALVAVVARAATTPAPAPPARGSWTDPARGLRRCPAPGPGAWRGSARPPA